MICYYINNTRTPTPAKVGVQVCNRLKHLVSLLRRDDIVENKGLPGGKSKPGSLGPDLLLYCEAWD